MIRMRKKGSVDDILFIMIFTFVFAVSILFGYFFISKINDQIAATPDFSTRGKTIIDNAQGRYVALFDNLFVVVLVILVIATLFLASQIDTHPLFFPLTLVIFGFMSIVGGVAANSYNSIASSTALSVYAGDLTIIPFVMGHFIEFMLGFGFLVTIVMYGKVQQ